MFTSALSSILQLKNQDYDAESIRSEVMKLGKLNQIELMALMEFIHQMRFCTYNDHEREKLLNDIQTFLQNQFNTERMAISNTNNFIEYKTKSNNNNIGITILNHLGQFVLTDQLSRNILELNSKDELEQKNLFQLISKTSENKLKGLVKNYCLLQNGKAKDTFELAIYSDRNRKKSLKYLNQMASVPLKKKIKKNAQEKDIKPLSKEQTIMAKYLKCIKITITKVSLQIHQEFIDSFVDSNDIMLSNLEQLAKNTINQVAICEVKEMEEHIPLTVQELLQDPYINKHELKWVKRIKKFRGYLSDEDDN